jgi:hypothetical protein
MIRFTPIYFSNGVPSSDQQNYDIALRQSFPEIAVSARGIMVSVP